MKRSSVPQAGKSYRIRLPKKPGEPVRIRERWLRENFAKIGITSPVPSYAYRRKKLGIPTHIDNIVFVCIGNRHRSFAAAELMKHQLQKKGIAATVESMGLSALIGGEGHESVKKYVRARGAADEKSLAAHKTKNWAFSPEALPILAQAGKTGIIVTMGAGIKHALFEDLSAAQNHPEWKEAAKAAKRIFTLRGIVTGKENQGWKGPRSLSLLTSPDPHNEPADKQHLPLQEIDFLVHELVHVLGPALKQKS